MTRLGLTSRQVQVLDFVRAYLAEHRYGPGLKEIAAALGLRAVSTVHKHVAELQRKGYVFREPDSRTIALAGHHDTCPLCGRSLETTAS
jgi:SOS-response transcriptional repressor LexA